MPEPLLTPASATIDSNMGSRHIIFVFFAGDGDRKWLRNFLSEEFPNNLLRGWMIGNTGKQSHLFVLSIPPPESAIFPHPQVIWPNSRPWERSITQHYCKDLEQGYNWYGPSVKFECPLCVQVPPVVSQAHSALPTLFSPAPYVPRSDVSTAHQARKWPF